MADLRKVYAKAAYDALMKGTDRQQLAYVAGAWRSSDMTSFEDLDHGIQGVWIGVAAAARAPASQEEANETFQHMFGLAQNKLRTQEGRTKLAEYAAHYLTDKRIEAQNKQQDEVPIPMRLLGIITMTLQALGSTPEFTAFEEETAKTLPCGCRGIIHTRTNGGQFIAKIIEYCEYHHEHWFRGVALPEGYFDRKVDNDLADQLQYMLQRVLRGEPIDPDRATRVAITDKTQS